MSSNTAGRAYYRSYSKRVEVRWPLPIGRRTVRSRSRQHPDTTAKTQFRVVAAGKFTTPSPLPELYTAASNDGGALSGKAADRGEASTTRTRIHQSRRHHQRRVRARRAGVDRQPEHAASRKAARRRSHEHLLVLPQEGRPAQRDERPRPAPVRFRYAVHRGEGLARDPAQSRAGDAKDLPGQPDPGRPDPDPVGTEPPRGEAGSPGSGEGDQQPGRGGAVPRGRVRYLLGDVGSRPRVSGAAATSRKEPGRRGGTRRHRRHDVD